jgi:hypothetical protein
LQSVAFFPGTGKSRAARAVARIYHKLAVLPLDRVLEVAVREPGIGGKQCGPG